MKGQIVKISSDLHFVNSEDKVYPCKCRGLFRKEHIIPVVGDYVLFSSDKIYLINLLCLWKLIMLNQLFVLLKAT